MGNGSRRHNVCWHTDKRTDAGGVKWRVARARDFMFMGMGISERISLRHF
jgi:hypothetical protein